MPEGDWFAIHDADGKLMSIGTVVSDDLPATWTSVRIGGNPPASNQVWDEVTRTFVTQDPPEPLVDQVMDQLGALTLLHRTLVRDAIVDVYGDG